MPKQGEGPTMSNDLLTLRIRKTWVRLALVVLLTAAVAAPMGAMAAHRFTDVPDTNPFHDDISWLADAGVTLGCNPPANDQFCPGNAVTRQQMSAFMRRLATNRVVDAGTLEGVAATGFVGAGQADSVTPAMTTAEPGVAQAASLQTVQLGGGVETLLEVTINAPAAGYAVVAGSADVFIQHTSGTMDVGFLGVSDQAAVLEADENKDVILEDSAPSGLYSETFSMQKAFPVVAGANTFYLLGWESAGVLQVGDMQIVAMYFPTAYGTVELLEEPTAAPGIDAID